MVVITLSLEVSLVEEGGRSYAESIKQRQQFKCRARVTGCQKAASILAYMGFPTACLLRFSDFRVKMVPACLEAGRGLHFRVCFIWLMYSLFPYGWCGGVEKNMAWDNKAVTSTQASSRHGLFSRVLAEESAGSCLCTLTHPLLTLQGEGPWAGRHRLAALDLKAGNSLLP